MRLKKGILKKINRLTGYNKTYLCDLFATRKRPSFKRAMRLEKITGIHHDLWLGGTSEKIKAELNKIKI